MLEVSKRGQVVNESQLLLVLGLGPLSESYGACWGHMQLVWEILGKSEAWAKTDHSYGNAAGNTWVGLQVGGVGSQGITRVWQTVWTRLMDSQIWHPPGSSMEEGLRKGKMPTLPTLLSRRKLPLLLSFWCLSSYWPSAGTQREWVQVSLCVGPFKRTPGTPEELHLTQPPSMMVFTAKFWGIFFLALCPWAGDPGVRLKPLAPQVGLLQVIYSSRFLSTTCGCGTSPSVPLPFLLVSMWLILCFLGCKTSVQLDFR